jgi:hypothetical protein
MTSQNSQPDIYVTHRGLRAISPAKVTKIVKENLRLRELNAALERANLEWRNDHARLASLLNGVKPIPEKKS